MENVLEIFDRIAGSRRRRRTENPSQGHHKGNWPSNWLYLVSLYHKPQVQKPGGLKEPI